MSHLLAVGLRYDSDPLSLSFPICEVVILTALPSKSSQGDHWDRFSSQISVSLPLISLGLCTHLAVVKAPGWGLTTWNQILASSLSSK